MQVAFFWKQQILFAIRAILVLKQQSMITYSLGGIQRAYRQESHTFFQRKYFYLVTTYPTNAQVPQRKCTPTLSRKYLRSMDE